MQDIILNKIKKKNKTLLEKQILRLKRFYLDGAFFYIEFNDIGSDRLLKAKFKYESDYSLTHLDTFETPRIDSP